MSITREMIASAAHAELGYTEGVANVTKYARDFDNKWPEFYNGKKQGVAWCDIFVDWIFVTVCGEEKARQLLCQPKKSCGAGCYYSYGYFKAKGQTSKKPEVGAQIFFTNNGKESGICHTGIVVEIKNDKVYTIEGNSNNKVEKKCYLINNSRIYGYGIIKYDKTVESTNMPPNTTPSTDTVDYAMSKNNSFIGQWKVTAKSGLHIRTGASTSKKSLGILPLNSKVTCYGYYTNDWLLVVSGGKTGFCNRKYLSKC